MASHHPLINSLLSLVANQCGGVEISIWGLVQRSVFGCGMEIDVGMWVCHGFCLGLLWAAWVQISVGFSWWLLAWVSSKVVGVGFGGWNGGGMVVDTVIMVVVTSQCRGNFAWWWRGFLARWAMISWISSEIGGVVLVVGSTVEVGLVCWWRRRQEVM